MTNYSHEENATATFKMKMQQVIEKVAKEQFQDICRAKVIYEEESDEEEEEIQIEELEQAPPKIEDNKPQVHDPMEEVNLDTLEMPMITYIGSLLSTNLKEHIISYHCCRNSKIALVGIMMKFQDWIKALWNKFLPSGLNSIISNNYLEECMRK